MKRSVSSSVRRQVGEALQIIDVFDGAGFAFDFVIAELRGDHPTVMNRTSDRTYFVLEGRGTARVADETFEVQKDDLICIHAGMPHSISGNLRYIVVTAPPFDPANEEVF